MSVNEAKTAILNNKTALGIEFGSTRIKAVLVDDKYDPIASGSYEWENRYENGVWTYSLDDIHKGLQGSYSDLVKDVQEKYGVELTSVGALIFQTLFLLLSRLAFDVFLLGTAIFEHLLKKISISPSANRQAPKASDLSLF